MIPSFAARLASTNPDPRKRLAPAESSGTSGERTTPARRHLYTSTRVREAKVAPVHKHEGAKSESGTCLAPASTSIRTRRVGGASVSKPQAVRQSWGYSGLLVLPEQSSDAEEVPQDEQTPTTTTTTTSTHPRLRFASAPPHALLKWNALLGQWLQVHLRRVVV